MTVEGAIAFTPLREDDLELVHAWIVREHVQRWWDPWETIEQVREGYLPAIEGRDPTDLYLIVVGARPVGLIQTYRYADYAESAHLGLEPGVAGVDLFIGEAKLLGQGLGPRVLEAFVEGVVFADPETVACAAEVDVTNRRSLRAFENAGFHRLRDVADPQDGKAYRLMWRGRG